MKILLIAPSSGRWRKVGRTRLFNGKTFRFSLLSLLTVAAATPEGDSLRIIDEQVDDVPWDEDFDLVGITAMTATAPRAYELADAFRAKGVPVVLGGMHPTFRPQEALAHADAVVRGEAEGVWADVLEDARGMSLRGVYQAPEPHSLKGLRQPPRKLLPATSYATVQAVQATRGCPHTCAFCSVSAFNNATQRRRPVGEVAAEVAALPERFFLLVDDSLAAEPDYAKALFRALIPLRKHWFSQVTLKSTDDPELIRLAAESGCVGVFVGLETFSDRALESVDKGFNQVEEYRWRIRMLHEHGIAVEAGVVLGFDADGPEVFARTLRLLDELEIDMIQVSVLTPLPGTRFFEEMERRVLDRNWAHYDYHHVVFQPRRMTAESLQAGHDWLTREFYRPWRILRRLWRQSRRPRGVRGLLYAAAVDFAYLGRILRWGIKGWDPEAEGGLPESRPAPRAPLAAQVC
jgi:radical SAM superfamily enzyme YgiQ (UPF0313 family)